VKAGETPQSSIETAENAAVPGDDVLADRYGRTPIRRKRGKLFGLIVAGLFAIVLVSWVVWAGLDADSASLEAKDLAHTVVDDHSVSVVYSLTIPPESTAQCAVQALNEKFAIVGWKVVDISAASERTRQFTESVRTSEPAVTGLIYRCWLT
jgi:hypothetical protein